MSIDSTVMPPEVDRFPHLPQGCSLYDRLLRGLKRKNPELNEYCAGVFIDLQTKMGVDVVTILANEAVAKGKQPDFRIRILDVIQRIGEPLDESFFAVYSLISHPVERVSRKAMEVIDELKPASLNGKRRR